MNSVNYQAEIMVNIHDTVPQAFIDTPSILYREWNQGIDRPLGSLPKNLKICLIGAGISNAIAALELVKAGAHVTLLEARSEVGGRARSEKFEDGFNIAEMGAMRFPISSGLLLYYAKEFGYCFISDFPDPGRVPTFISYRGRNVYWKNLTAAPNGFEKVHVGWDTFVKNGLKNDDTEIFTSLYHLRTLLQSKDQEVRLTAVPLWQKYLDFFKKDSFFGGLRRIFGPEHEWDIPGQQEWEENDFEMFGSLGIGCGGYAPVFCRDFTYICRLVVNGLSSEQATFAKMKNDRLFPAPIQELVTDICSKAASLGATVKLETRGEVVSSCKINGSSSVAVEETCHGVTTESVYDLVIIGTTTRAANVMMRYLSSYSSKILSEAASTAVNNISMISSTKVFARVKKFWNEKSKENYPRVILSDTKASQLYTLDYGHPDYGIVLLTYAWGDLSDQIMTVKSDKELYRILKNQIHEIMRDSEFSDYADQLTPVEENDIRVVHWQLDPTSLGAFTLARPGQARLIADAFYDFKSLLEDQDHSGVLLNGDSITFEGGWIEAALRTSMNVTSAILLKYGSVEESCKAPINLLNRNIYKY
jgi:tryptophan 2-monooxygenase